MSVLLQSLMARCPQNRIGMAALIAFTCFTRHEQKTTHRPFRRMLRNCLKELAQQIPTQCALAVLILASWVGTACSEPQGKNETGDVELGAHLWAACASCHASTGSAAGIPSLSDFTKKEFIDALRAFRSGARVNSSMGTITADLSDSDIDALGAYFMANKHNGGIK